AGAGATKAEIVLNEERFGADSRESRIGVGCEQAHVSIPSFDESGGSDDGVMDVQFCAGSIVGIGDKESPCGVGDRDVAIDVGATGATIGGIDIAVDGEQTAAVIGGGAADESHS